MLQELVPKLAGMLKNYDDSELTEMLVFEA